MKNILVVAAFLALLTSCTSAVKKEEGKVTDEVSNTPAEKKARPIKAPGNENRVVQDVADIPGFWVGMFDPGASFYENDEHMDEELENYSNKINLVIEKIEQGVVTGHSIVAGNDRPFTGTMTQSGNVFSFQLKEPGDQKYDGAFSFKIQKEDTAAVGEWHAFGKIDIPSREYKLQKRLYHYDPDVVPEDWTRFVDWTKAKKVSRGESEEERYEQELYATTTEDVVRFNASRQQLTAKDLSNLKKGDLIVIRNCIYARHGYSFKSRPLRNFFDYQPWYIPVSTDVKAQLTELEKQNISLLMRYEKNAKEYYDAFGR